MTSFLSETAIYVGRIREFRRIDWWVYLAWVGLMLGLVASTTGFLWVGRAHDAPLPTEALMVPIGAGIFAVSIAIDTIGHRTIYRLEIAKAEALVHHITIFCGIGSSVLLCAAYSVPALWIPAMVLTALSFFYSIVDEFFHWRRYVQHHADRVEMTSHVGILIGHSTMMLGWWVWYFGGYQGVAETVAHLPGLGA
ncbi:MAG: hypothetical protein KBG28_20770 [Kofleriaceae bacterium]|jgi:hypothetical protein|nr:hypothetical protein [Kofleriaceae bacterium]MBP6841780.1 hypothetical protein [Kofleriaceae bacterium]MBP9206419.1 hypothetical protein [Kofleriaceae bacterium]